MRRIAACLVLALVLAAAAMPARAVHSAACGGTWRGAGNRCDLSLRGLPLTVYGDAEAASGQVRVHVAISYVAIDGPHVLVECSAQDSKFASCDAELTVGAPVDPFGQTLPLVCSVDGTPAGTYACSSRP